MLEKPVGRPHKLPYEIRKLISQKIRLGEMTYQAASQAYNVSQGVIGSCLKEFSEPAKRDAKKRDRSQWKLDEDKTEREKELETQNKILKAEIGDLYLQVQMLKKAEAYKRWLRSEASSIITSENLDQHKEAAG